MNLKNKIYIFLCLNFTALIIIGNLIYQKYVYLNFFGMHKFALSAGTVFYPITFLISDLIAEFYGKAGAKFCIRVTIIISIFISIIISFIANLEATPWSKVNDQNFNDIFAGFNIAFASSIIANYFAQIIDIR